MNQRVSDERLAEMLEWVAVDEDDIEDVMKDMQDARAEIAGIKCRTCKCGNPLITDDEKFVNECLECRKKEVHPYSAITYA